MKVEDKPRHRTLSRSLDLLRQRGLIVEKDDRYQINPQQRRVLEYYANSIEHLWKQEDPA